MQLTDIPVLAILAGLSLRFEVIGLLYTTPETDVAVDKALPGRLAPGVTSPDLEPFVFVNRKIKVN